MLVTTPHGSLQHYDITTNSISTLGTNLPSDASDPARLNTISSAPSASTYTIKKGDTLSSIAKRYRTTIGAIATENSISNPNKIYAGDTLNITN